MFRQQMYHHQSSVFRHGQVIDIILEKQLQCSLRHKLRQMQ